MKDLINKLSFSTLLCIFFANLTACGDLPEPDSGITIDPRGDCATFILASPGQETIIYSKSGLTLDELDGIRDSLRPVYRNGDLYLRGYIPLEENNGYCYDYNEDVDPLAVPNCYEITMTIEFPESSVPSVSDLLGYGFSAVRIYGCIATCKEYGWAFTEEGAEEFIPRREKSYNSGKTIDRPDWEVEPNRLFSGTIVGTSTIKNLGHELYNEPIIF